jgi:ribosomal protein L20A (L18A)
MKSIRKMNMYERMYRFMNSKQRTDRENIKGNIKKESY